MKKNLFIILGLVIFIIIFSGYKQQSTIVEGTEVGNFVPNFTLNDMAGNSVDINSLRRKKVIHIVFWGSG
jgi:hypothetical protein